MGQVYIKGVGMTRFGKREESLLQLFAEAAKMAMDDARIYKFDAIYVGAMNPEEFTGSGNIAVSLAVNLPHAEVYASDTSKKALRLARFNAQRHLV